MDPVTTRTATAPGTGHGLTVLLGCLTAMGPLALDMYLPAFPEIAGTLHVGAGLVQLSLTACLVGLALGQVLSGPLSDRFGRRRPIIAGVAAFTVASLLCAAAPSAPVLIALRVVQGFAGGVGVVVTRAVVRDLYAGAEAARYFSRLTLVFGVAPIAAPSLGSAVLRGTSWRGIFVALAIIGALLTAAAVARLPETLPPARRRSPGLAGARTVLTDRIFLGYALAQGLAFAGMFAYISGSSFVLQQGYALSDTTFSLLFGANALGLIALSQVNRRLLDRFAPRTLLVATLLAGLCAGLGLLVAALAGTLAGLAAALFCFISTVGMVTPNSTALALDRHPEIAGTAAAVLGGVQFTLGAAAAPLVALMGNDLRGGSMAAAVLICASLAVLAILLLTRPPRHRTGRP
jgi:DHA1 family bicyclomycin/chloramphenicol resistance-like MFS transporter